MMSTQITIHGKRVKTIYDFTVKYKGKRIQGEYITVNGIYEDKPILYDEDKIKFLNTTTSDDFADIDPRKIQQAIKDYDKAHS